MIIHGSLLHSFDIQRSISEKSNNAKKKKNFLQQSKNIINDHLT